MSDSLATAVFSPLQRADGSAAYSANGYSVICSINGPIEVQRRDELPEAAAIDVVVRPAIGIGGLRERHLETILENTLRHVVLVAAHPRTLIQVTIQVTGASETQSSTAILAQAESGISILPALLQVAGLALLTTSISLSMTFTSVLIAVNERDELSIDPDASVLKDASSIHVLAFSSLGEPLVMESEGDFSFDMFGKVLEMARKTCYFGEDEGFERGPDVDMDMEERLSKTAEVRNIVGRKVAHEQRWRKQEATAR